MATILIVEDRSENRDFLSGLLSYRGHDVVGAPNADLGLSAARTKKPDLIITDVLMPRVDGYEFVRRLRIGASTANIPVIFWTATFGNERGAKDLAERCGVAAILNKPSEPEDVLETVDRVLADASVYRGAPVTPEFDREHAVLLTDKLFDQVRELEAANERLSASEGQYRSLFNGNPFPMWIVDDESSMFLAVNGAAIDHYGYSHNEFLKLSVRDILPLEEPDIPPREFTRHRLRNGSGIEVSIFRQTTLFGNRRATLEMIEDVTERNQAEKKIRESEAQLHHLAERLRSTQEEERTRISRHLHDQLGQQLTALRMTHDWILRRLPPSLASGPAAGIEHKLRSSQDAIDEMITTVQDLATELRPGVLDYGIAAAIEWLVEDFQSRSEIACTVDVPDEDLPDDGEPLDPHRETEMYRIFQEALTNVARHSGATRIEVFLRREGGSLVLEVHDNGRGITREQANSPDAIGLLGMRERAALIGAKMSIAGNPRTGTTVRLEVPLASA